MPLNIAAQEVKLPDKFSVTQRSENEGILFDFSSPIQLPYDDGSLREYQKKAVGGFYAPSMRREDMGALVYAVLRATIPEFVGANGFYQSNFDASGIYGVGVMEVGSLVLTHSEGQQPKAELKVKVRSPEKFFPVLSGESVERPTIDKGSIWNKIYLGVDIPHPEGGNSIYVADIGATILTSLVNKQQLTLGQRDHRIRDGYEAGRSRVYIMIDNPTLERMQTALSEERILAEYFAEHIEPIKEATKAFVEARELNSRHKKEVVSAHKGLIAMIERARNELDQEIPAPADIDGAVARIDTHINAKLREATDKIAHLFEEFPAGVLDYAIPESKEQ